MCKAKSMLLLCSLIAALAACVDDPERHELTPVGNRIVLYADQTLDSLRFYSYDSWTVTPANDWISVVGDNHQDVVYDYTKLYLNRVFLSLQPNTTGKTRVGTVLVESYENAYSAPFIQLGLLNISHPAYTVDAYLDQQSGIPETAHYVLTDSAHWTNDSICFSVENNWELAFDGDAPEWLTLSKATDLPGKHRVELSLVPNDDTENAREAKLKLVSGKVSNEITVRQLPAKKKKE